MNRSLGLMFVLLLLTLVYQAAFAQSAPPPPPPPWSWPNDDSHTGETRIPGRAQELWDTYVFNTVMTRSLQEGCEPVQVRPASDIPYRGVVILLHGFTSCPKQYSLMAKSFAALGYHVLIPVLPGHGGEAPDELDAQTFLPGAQNWFNYDSFARWINTIARAVDSGDVHIGGLCLGGTIAVRAMQLEPKLYKRSVLFSPFFEVSTRLLGRLGRLLGRVNDVLNVKNGFEMPIALDDLNVCEGIERDTLGRAGYCRTRLNNLIAVARFGHFVKSNMNGFRTEVQTIIVDNDPVAHPQVSLAVLENSVGPAVGRGAACVMARSANHSFFSPTDLPMPKPWLPDLHQELGGFLVHGRSLITSRPTAYAWPRSGAGVPACALWP